MERKRPNVLVIMSDQHHAGAMGCAGDPVASTPAMDRLASGGVRFRGAYCPFPLCGPSRMSFMTARHPHEIGVWDNETELQGDIPTFAHAFLAAGYDTVLSGRMHFVGWDQRHGFVERLVGDVPESVYIQAGWQLRRVLGDLVDTAGMSLPGITRSGPGRTGYHAYDEAVTAATVDWLHSRAQAPPDRPFLLTVGYTAPHCPFVAPPEDFEAMRERISPDDLPPVDPDLHPLNAVNRVRFGVDPLPPADARWRTHVAYYGLCRFVDRQIGAVLAALEEAGLAEDTIVVYTSDHGEMLGEHGMWWKTTLYDGACRVPLLISWPGRAPAGFVCDESVSLIDIGPTVLDMAGAGAMPGVSGTSLRPLWSGSPDDRDNAAFAEYTEPGRGVVARMVRTGRWKYNTYRGMAPELFDLRADPGETTNLAGRPDHADTERELDARVRLGWDADRVAERMELRPRERELIAGWIRAAAPPEPVPLWFEGAQENTVDTTAAWTPPSVPAPDSGGAP